MSECICVVYIYNMEKDVINKTMGAYKRWKKNLAKFKIVPITCKVFLSHKNKK